MSINSSDSEYFPDTQKLESGKTIGMDSAYVEKYILPGGFKEWYINLKLENNELFIKTEKLLEDNRLKDAIILFNALDEKSYNPIHNSDKFNIANGPVSRVLN